MSFTHKDHKHDTVAEARDCERPSEPPRRSLGPTVLDKGVPRPAVHSTPCVCGPYDLCWEIRVATASSWRDLYRTYSD